MISGSTRVPTWSDRALNALVLIPVFLAPLPLGSNMLWAAYLLAALCYLAAAYAWYLVPKGARLALPKSFVMGMVVLSIYPLVQIIPLPSGVLSSLSPMVLAYRAKLGDGVGAGFFPLSLDTGSTFDYFVIHAAFLQFSLAMAIWMGRLPSIERLPVVIVVVGVFNVVYGVAELATSYVQGVDLLTVAGMSGTYVNKNHFASLMEMSLPFAAGLTLLAKRKGSPHTVKWLALVCVLALGLVFSASKGGALAFLSAGLLVIANFSSSRRARGVAWTMVLLVGLIGCAVIFAGRNDLMSYPDVADRLWQWRYSVEYASDFIWVGSGAGTYDFLFPIYKGVELSHLRYDHAHNDYVELLATFGILGAGVFLFVIAKAASAMYSRAIRRESLDAQIMLAMGSWSVLSMCLHAFVDFNWQIPGNYLLFFVVMVYTLYLAVNGSVVFNSSHPLREDLFL